MNFEIMIIKLHKIGYKLGTSYRFCEHVKLPISNLIRKGKKIYRKETEKGSILQMKKSCVEVHFLQLSKMFQKEYTQPFNSRGLVVDSQFLDSYISNAATLSPSFLG